MLIYLIPTILLLLTAVAFARLLYYRGKTAPAAPAAGPYLLPDPALERFRTLLRLRTVSHQDESLDDGAAFDAALDYIRSAFPLAAQSFEFHTLSRYACYAVWRGADDALLPGLLLAHYDVVDAGGGWSSPPFAAEMKGDAVYGRGSLDDKNSLFGLLEAAESLLAEGYAPRRSLYFAFGGDEECAGTRGAAVLAAEFRRQGLEFEFALDEGAIVARDMLPGLKVPVGLIGVEEKGFLSVRLSLAGEAGHASMPSSGVVTHRMIRALSRITGTPFPARITPGLRSFLQALSGRVSPLMGLIFANLWLFGGLLKLVFARNPRTDALIRTTVAATILRGGEKDNVLPDAAEAVCNIRILPGESVEQVIAALKRRADEPDLLIEAVDPEHAFEPVAASAVGGRIYRALEEALRTVFPTAAAAPFLVNVTTDSRWYVSLCRDVYRFLPVELGPADLAGIHGADEHISNKNLRSCVHFYREFMQGVGNG